MNVSSFFTPILKSPLLWSVLAGLFIGAAAMSPTTRTRHKRDPERARTRKWVAACVLFSIAVVCGLLAVFSPGPGKIPDVRLAWVTGGAAVVSFCALRFRKSLGIPVLILLVVAGTTFGLFLRSIHTFTGETEIASVRVISVTDSSMRLELAPRGRAPVLLTMDGVEFSPVVKVVIFDDLLVFLGAKTWYRFEGMTSFDRNGRQGNTDYHLPQPSGISEWLWRFYEEHETEIPGVKTAQTERPSKRPNITAKEFATYAIMVQNDGGVEIVPIATDGEGERGQGGPKASP